jgi:hypothetical protein
MIFFYGTRASRVQTTTPQATCLTCNTTGPHTLSTFGRYVHLYWIPLISVGKVSVSECQHCRVTHDEKTMPTQLRELTNAQNAQVSAPLWHWLGLGLLLAAMAVSAVINLTSPKNTVAETPKTKAITDIPTGNGIVASEDDEPVNADDQSEKEEQDIATPDPQRAALAAAPVEGDIYVFHIKKEAGSEVPPPARSELTVGPIVSKSARCTIRTVVGIANGDSSVTTQEVTYPLQALKAMESIGSIDAIIRK